MTDRKASDISPPSTGVRRRLRKKHSEPLNLPPPSDSETESHETDDDDPLPDRDKGRQGTVTVKEAIEGLFSSKTVQSTPHELILVKRYSHGKPFRQRLAYVVYKHPKTSSFIRYAAFIMSLLICLLYIVEATYIDELLKREDDIIIDCLNKTLSNYSELAIVDLILIPKHYILWGIQILLNLVCLLGASVGIYVKQDLYGSVFKNFIQHLNFSLFVTLIIGVAYVITIFLPQCLHNLWIPSFLCCWPARRYFMYILHQNSEASFFRSFRGFRTTAISLVTFLLCFMFSCLCFIHHFERLGSRITLFETYWLVIVTFSTVGYGDISPVHWTGKLIITLFIIAALLYLPSKFDKLWTSFILHRKHYRVYNKTPVTKHILLLTVNLKPLVIRDFLNEIYSDRVQMDTQCVVMIEQPLADNIKHLLEHPIWSQRVTILRGSPLRASDLARAKARSADACFLLTSRSGNPDEADEHTILGAWTVKYYAPKCKLFVHILQPKNKQHLQVADEVICEGEITSALLSLNSVCPGIATLAALLMHTFTYEGRGFHSPEYKWYERCSPVEIYHGRLGDSRYFHHFAGKNFLFTAVVAYRKFHVVLLGICPAGKTDIIFNPGLSYMMQVDDTCYYISETHEDDSDYQVVQPTCFQTGLWRTSATLGLLGMYISGIDPVQLLQQSQSEYEEHEVCQRRKNTFQRKHYMSKQSLESSSATIVDPIFITEDLHDSSPSPEDLDEQLAEQYAADVTNWQHDVQLGLQLLKYHAEGEQQAAKPVVKLNVVPRLENQHSIRSHSMHVPSISTDEGRHPSPVLETIQETAPELVIIEPSPAPTPQDMNLEKQRKNHGQPALFGFRRSSSHDFAKTLKAEDKKKSSSLLKLTHIGDNISLQSFVSSMISYKSDITTHSIDEIVSLELDDISEVEELEGLEEGRPLDVGGMDLSDEESINEDRTSPLHVPVHFMKYVEGPVSILPYCGCEPLHCHLSPNQRSYDEIKIDQTCSGHDVIEQWHHKCIIVYSDKVSANLYHFITPLRASYLPACTLRPIVLLLGQMPDPQFLALLAELPLIYFLVGSLHKTCDLLRAGILFAESIVVFPPSKSHQEDIMEHLVDAEHVTSIHTIAKLFPNVRVTIAIKYRYNIRFVYTTPYEQLSIQKLGHMARKGDHLTYLFLPQLASGKAFSSSLLDTLLYQAYKKPNIINLFRQLIGCFQVKGSGFLWKVVINEELAKLTTYVRVFQRVAASLRFIPIGLYRSAPLSQHFDPEEIKGYDANDLEKSRKFLIGQLRSLGITREVEEFSQPQNQEFVYLNPPPDFIVIEGDIILGIRPQTSNMSPNKSPPITHPPPYLPTMDSYIHQTTYTEERRSDHVVTSPVQSKHKGGYPGKFFPFLVPPATVNIVAETYDL